MLKNIVGIIMFIVGLILTIVFLVCDRNKWTILVWALVLLLLSAIRTVMDIRDKRSKKFCDAIRENDTDTVQKFLQKKTSLNHAATPNLISKAANGAWPLSPFQTACRYGRADIVRSMMPYKPPVDQTEPYFGFTPLGLAMLNFPERPADSAEVMTVLLKAGAATDDIDWSKFFPDLLRWKKQISPDEEKKFTDLLTALKERGIECPCV